MRVHIKTDLCCGSLQCVEAAPEVFAMGGDGLGVVLQMEPPEALHTRVRLACDNCPLRAVVIEESPNLPEAAGFSRYRRQ